MLKRKQLRQFTVLTDKWKFRAAHWGGTPAEKQLYRGQVLHKQHKE